MSLSLPGCQAGGSCNGEAPGAGAEARAGACTGEGLTNAFKVGGTPGGAQKNWLLERLHMYHLYNLILT